MEKDQNRLAVKTLVLNLSVVEIRQWVAFQFGEPAHEETSGRIGSTNNPYKIRWTVNSGENIKTIVAIQMGWFWSLNFFAESGGQVEIEIARL